MSSSYVTALLREREGYRLAGDSHRDRLREADRVLAGIGIHVDDTPEVADVEVPAEVETATEAPVERAVKSQPRKR